MDGYPYGFCLGCFKPKPSPDCPDECEECEEKKD
jgi:hypothetical protein